MNVERPYRPSAELLKVAAGAGGNAFKSAPAMFTIKSVNPANGGLLVKAVRKPMDRGTLERLNHAFSHGPLLGLNGKQVPAGKVISISDENDGETSVLALVTNDAEAVKLREGVYVGISLGSGEASLTDSTGA